MSIKYFFETILFPSFGVSILLVSIILFLEMIGITFPNKIQKIIFCIAYLPFLIFILTAAIALLLMVIS